MTDLDGASMICLKDYMFLGKIPWHVLAVDEAHRLKNQDSQLFQALSLWKFREPVLLTGTPVQNNLDELYSLLSFVHSENFPAWKREKFLNKYSNVDEEEDVSKLHKLLKPYLLRRTKSAVLKDLPKKSEIVIYHGITKLQRELYKAILTKDIDVFDGSSSSYSGGTRSLMNILMQLRKCVNHPYLFDGVEPEPFELGEHLVESSGKLILIDCLLKYLKSTGHKVLMFSQMTHMLDVLQDYMGYRGYTYERLDGSVRGEERFLAVQNFNQNEETFVFLLSTKAGGQGLNLTGADTVIFVDSDFNPQNDLQAAARAHRIGQTRPVKIIRLIGQNTVEEIILKRAEMKLKLSEKVIEEGEFSLGMSKQGRQELITDDKVKLQDILKFGVNELLNEENSCSADVDFVKILGPSVDGEWQLSEATVAEPSTSELMGKEEEGEDEEEGETEPLQNMYVFEGTDYSKEPTAADIRAFEELVAAERAALELKATAEKGLRKRQTTVLMGPLPEIMRKPRKKLTAEELEERRKKRQENAERRAKEEEDKERKRKEELWRSNSYTSCNISIESDRDEEEEEEVKEEEEERTEEEEASTQPRKRDIHYVIGDVTHPQDTGSDINIIVHCADDSGRWGRGGLFTAISARSDLPQQKYDLAGWMKDLELGDCHLFPMDDKEVDMLGLIIAQHRDRKNNLSGIHLSALSQGLKRIYRVAKSRNGSVHLPRIGHDTPGFNWYGTERLIKKHLASRGIPTYIYYFPRKKQQQLKRKSEDNEETHKGKGKQYKMSLPTEGESKNCLNDGDKDSGRHKSISHSATSLPSIFQGVSAYLHVDSIPANEIKNLKRYIVTYDGDVEATVSNSTTHLVAAADCAQKDLSVYKDSYPDIKMVTSSWIHDSLKKKKCLPEKHYTILQ